MKKCTQKLERIAIGLLIVLSLFVSSVAACVCSHHTENAPKIEVSSCHSHPEAKKEDGSNEEGFASFDANEDCSCLQPTPRVYAKSETIKIEKQTTALSFSGVEFKAISVILISENAYYEKPFYLSDSFYNLKSPRAPPIL